MGPLFVVLLEPLGTELSDLLQDPDHALGWQGGLHFHRQRLPDPFIQPRESPKPPAAVQGVSPMKSRAQTALGCGTTARDWAGRAGSRFLEDGHELRLGELRLPHGNLLARGGYSTRKFSVWPVSDLGELPNQHASKVGKPKHFTL
jgi:hypothetical protein